MDVEKVLKRIDSQEWKQHPVLKNVECSELGLIKVNGEFRKPTLWSRTGRNNKLYYCIVGIGGKACYLHRLVFECFNGLIPDGMVIDHINTHSLDNRVENLRAVTATENNKNPLTLKHLKESIGKPVLQRDKKTGEIVGYFDSIAEASRQTGINYKVIQRASDPNSKWAGYKTGYKWEYAKYRYSCKWGKWWISGDL